MENVVSKATSHDSVNENATALQAALTAAHNEVADVKTVMQQFTDSGEDPVTEGNSADLDAHTLRLEGNVAATQREADAAELMLAVMQDSAQRDFTAGGLPSPAPPLLTPPSESPEELAALVAVEVARMDALLERMRPPAPSEVNLREAPPYSLAQHAPLPFVKQLLS